MSISSDFSNIQYKQQKININELSNELNKSEKLFKKLELLNKKLDGVKEQLKESPDEEKYINEEKNLNDKKIKLMRKIDESSIRSRLIGNKLAELLNPQNSKNVPIPEDRPSSRPKEEILPFIKGILTVPGKRTAYLEKSINEKRKAEKSLEKVKVVYGKIDVLKELLKEEPKSQTYNTEYEKQINEAGRLLAKFDKCMAKSESLFAEFKKTQGSPLKVHFNEKVKERKGKVDSEIPLDGSKKPATESKKIETKIPDSRDS